MKKLPLEIIIAITSYLSFKDKLNLACCSKNFYRIISEKTLYSQLVFLQEGRFRQALEFFKGRLTSGLQVHKLCIGNMTYDEQLVTTLPALFARVWCLQFKEGPDGYDGMDGDDMKTVVKDWKNYVEST